MRESALYLSLEVELYYWHITAMTLETTSATASDFAVARQAMIDSQLRPQGVTDARVLAAMAAVPREDFVPAEVRPLAYSDRPVPLGQGRALAPPAALGEVLEALLPQDGERALVIGGGTGYSAAVLEAMGLKVTAIDAADGPLESGHSKGAPYDVILIDGAVPAIPDALVAQLGDGGRLGGTVIDGGISKSVVGLKAGKAFGLRFIGDSGFPPLPGFAKPLAFTF